MPFSGTSFFLSFPAMYGLHGLARTGPGVFQTTLNCPSAFTSPMNTGLCRWWFFSSILAVNPLGASDQSAVRSLLLDRLAAGVESDAQVRAALRASIDAVESRLAWTWCPQPLTPPRRVVPLSSKAPST